MKLEKTVRILLLLVFFTSTLYGQEVLNNNAPSLKWKQVNTPDFRVIFPEGFEAEAQRVANTLQTIHEPQKMGDKAPKKISIILRNQHAISNGFVTLGPRRSEFYTMPSQNNQFLGTNDWLDLLSVHEYRHIAQFQQSKTGFNKLFYYLFGENTQAGMAFSAAPPWFWEGDATTIETLNTPSGRGRIPEFSRVFKTNLLEKKAYNYNKQHLRSFKDFIPDHYRLGYHFVTHIRRRTGKADIWEDVSHDAFGLPFIPFTFSNALKKNTDKYLVENYNLMLEELKQEWGEQLDGIQPTTFETITKRRNDVFVDYSYPQALSDGTIVAFKQGIGDVGQLVRLDKDGNEIDKFVTGFMNNTGMLSSSGTKVVWDEYHFDPRWRAETFSVIKSYDFEKGKLEVLTEKSRYAGSAISPDGSKVATTETTVESKHYLVVLDIYGREIKRFDNPQNHFYSMPRWSDDGESIVVLELGETGRSVQLFDFESGKKNQLIKASQENIGYPVIYKGHLYYNSPYNGIDNIYALNLNNDQKFQVTNSKYGAYNPSFTDDGYLVYNEHTANGFDVVQTKLDDSKWIPLDDVVDRNVKYYEPLLEQEGHADILEQVSDNEYPVKKYSKLGHMLNVHSWGPFATTDINKAQFGIFSKDVLSTTAMELGYTYDVNEETGFFTAGLSYQGLYPILDFAYENGSRTSSGSFRLNQDSIANVDFEWKEQTFESGLRIPLQLTKSKYFTFLTFSDKVRVTKVTDFENDFDGSGRIISVTDSTGVIFRDELDNGTLINNVFEVSFSRLQKTSKRDILPQKGQVINLEHWSSPFGGDFNSGLFAIRSRWFFPSPLQLINKEIFKHHTLHFRYDFQSLKVGVELDDYYLRNQIGRPRGLSFPTDEKFHYLATNYTFPLIYPDLALGPILNVQRVKANLFLDYGSGTLDLRPDLNVFRSNTYLSVGTEITFDFNVMRFSPLFELGVRATYNISSPFDPPGYNIEFLIGNVSL